MHTTRNPAFRKVLGSADSPLAGGLPAGHPAYTPSDGKKRPITVDDVVTRGVIALSTIVAAAFLAVFLRLPLLAVPAFFVALGIGLYLTFRPRPSAAWTLTYAVAEGIVLGNITMSFDQISPGIVIQAVIGTFGAFAGMLIVYRTRVIRLSRKATRYIIGAALGVLILTLTNLLATLVLGIDLGLRNGGVMAVTFSIVCIAIATLSLLLNFEAATQMIRFGSSADWAWYIAFALSVTLVWLYVEILWLLADLRPSA